MTASAKAYALTLVSADCSLAKRVTVVDGVVTKTDDPLWPRLVAFETIQLATIDDLLDVLSGAAGDNPASCVVRAEPLADMGRRAIYDDPEKGPAGLRIMPRAWVGYDIEKVPSGGIDPLHEPDRAVAKARCCLPPPHHDTTVVWQITASAGKRQEELRLRLWFLLDRPLLGRQVEAWCRPGIDSGAARPGFPDQRRGSVMKPGCKVDHMPILEGRQGTQKSKALRTLVGDEWFTDQITDLGTKDSCQDLRGVWVIELSELSAIRPNEVERVKAFISRQVDHYRPSYGRRSVDFKRQGVFIGKLTLTSI